MPNEISKEKITIEELRLVISDPRPEATKKSPLVKFGAFLNSSFGLWLLSAIFISGAGACYTSYQNAQAEKRKKDDLIEKYDSEIGYRYSQVIGRLRNLDLKEFDTPEKKAVATDWIVKLLAVAPNASASNSDPNSKNVIYLYPEFANLPANALIAEQSRHLNANERAATSKILSEITFWGGLESIDKTKPDVVAGMVLEDLMIQRWKQLPYLNCTKQKPFC